MLLPANEDLKIVVDAGKRGDWLGLRPHGVPHAAAAAEDLVRLNSGGCREAQPASVTKLLDSDKA